MYEGTMTEARLNLGVGIEKVLSERYYQPGEDWQDLCQRVAFAVGEGAQRGSFMDMIYNRDFMPNSPCLMNAGTDIGQLSACFVLPMEDNLEGIFDTVKHAALVNKTGGGTGFSFSRIRGKNSPVGSTQGVASGPLSFASVIDSATEVIKQGGRRRGANMGVLRVDHPDILDFINAKGEEGVLKNFNLSVAITDEFMEAVKTNWNYHLVEPSTGKSAGQINAKEVWDLIIEKAHKNGEPGILFIDTANKDNPTPWLGDFEATNPCGEQWLLPFEACNLGSINLGHFVLHPLSVDTAEEWGEQAVDYARLELITRRAVKFLDNVVDLNKFPIEQIKEATQKTRKIGLGIMGLHDMLIQLGIPYDSGKGRDIASEVMEFIDGIAADKSSKLGVEEGPAPCFDFVQHYDNPVRNAARTSIQPTGTCSMIADCSSGCEPYFSIVVEKHVMDGEVITLVNKHFEKIAKREGWYSDQLMESVSEKGVFANTDVPAKWRNVFATAMEISPEGHLKMQAALQPHVDASISKTINLPNDATVEDVAKMYMEAWEVGCKGLTVYRDGSRDEQVLYTKTASDKKLAGEAVVSESGKAELPDTLNAKRFRVEGEDGQKIYIIICFNENEQPSEVFVKFPFDNQADQASKSTLWTTVCRLISLALRYGVPPSEVVKQLDKSAGSMRDLPSQISRILKTFLSETKAGYKSNCPECQGQMIFEEGCSKCQSCGWSKCD
jgi:ribonucleoside-diphosphate reductase alpha chain